VLLLQGADVTDVDDLAGWSALHYASFYMFAPAAQLLLDHGADVNTTDRYGTSALHLAARSGGDDVARVLVENGANVYSMAFVDAATPLHEAAFFGHAGVVQRLIDCGVEVSLRDTVCGQTPLHWAAGNGHFDCVVWLVSGWADVCVQDRAGNSPLHCAVLGPDAIQSEKIVRLLVRAGAFLQTVERNLDGNTPLCMARSAPLQRVLKAYVLQVREVQRKLTVAPQAAGTTTTSTSGAGRATARAALKRLCECEMAS
jgi:ankyrin repeat protein